MTKEAIEIQEEQNPEIGLEIDELGAMGVEVDFFEEIKKPRKGDKPTDELEADDEPEFQDEFKHVDDQDILLSKAALYFFDDSRAALLSVYAHKDIEHTKDFIYYKDLDSDRNQILLRAISIYTRQWRLGQSPLLIILVAVVISTVTMFYKARKIKNEKKEQEKQERQAKQKTTPTKKPKQEAKIRKINTPL